MPALTNRIPDLDFRQIRARQLSAAIMQELRPWLPDDDLDKIHEALFEVLWKNGVHLLTAADRERLGLEPHDDQGWTPSERVAREETRRDLLMLQQAAMIKR